MFDATDALPSAAYRARFVAAGAETQTLAAVDTDGRLHAVSFRQLADGLPSQPTGVTNFALHVARGVPLRRNESALLRQQVQIRRNAWTLTGEQSLSTTAVLATTSDGIGSTAFEPLWWINGLSLEGVDAGRKLDTSLTAASLAGSYRFAVTRFFNDVLSVDIDADGNVCTRPDTSPGTCLIAGAISVPADSGGFFDFSVYVVGSEIAAYHGRGWLDLDETDGTRTLAMVGGNADTALGIVAIEP